MRGFKEFRKPEVISDEALKNFGARTGLSADNANLYIFWTGAEYKRRMGSARSQGLYALNVKAKPVKLMDWLRDAARCRDPDNNVGFDPATIRSGLFLHQGAKPCVYLALEKRADGSFVAARNVENVAGLEGVATLKRGDLVIAAEDATPDVKVEVRNERVVETAESKALPAPATVGDKRARGKTRR